MANVSYNKFGVLISLSNSEVNVINGILNSGAGAASLLPATLAGLGITAAAATISAIASAILWMGSGAFSWCNANGRGVVITVLWVGLPWCKSQ